MIAFRALVRKEIAVLFGSPVAYLVLTMVALLTAITFFDLAENPADLFIAAHDRVHLSGCGLRGQIDRKPVKRGIAPCASLCIPAAG